MALSCLISGILIDIDHLYDFIKVTGFPFKIKDLYSIAFKRDIKHWTVVLHSWELVLLLGMAAWFSDWNPWITGLLIGVGHHIIMDAFNIRLTILHYSFIWRWKNDFTLK